jgi:hypothetical protein
MAAKLKAIKAELRRRKHHRTTEVGAWLRLLAYAFAARIPVLVAMFLARRGNGSKGWGTHYDAVIPQLAQASPAKKFLIEALPPQVTMWIGWTLAVGSVVGVIVAAVAYAVSMNALGRGKQATRAAA